MRLPDTVKSSLARCSMYCLPFMFLQPRPALAPDLEHCLTVAYVSSPQIDAQGNVSSRATINNTCTVVGSLTASPIGTIEYAVFAGNGTSQENKSTSMRFKFRPNESYVDGSVQLAGIDDSWDVQSCFRFTQSTLSGQLSHQTDYTCKN